MTLHYIQQHMYYTVDTYLCDCLLCIILETIKSVNLHISFHYYVIKQRVAIHPGFQNQMKMAARAQAPQCE